MVWSHVLRVLRPSCSHRQGTRGHHMVTGECVCNIKNGKPLIAHRVNIIANPHKVSRNSVDLSDFGEVL